MRKLLSALLCVTLFFVFGAEAFAEEEGFSFRNGILFGDSYEEIQNKEPQMRGHMIDDEYLMYGSVTLSGIRKCELDYYCRNDELYKISIFYGYGNTELESRQDEYNLIDEGLSRKYGEPETNLTKMDVFPEGAISRYCFSDERKVISVSQRIAEYGDYKVYIEHVLYGSIYELDNQMYYYHALTYQQVREEDRNTDLIDNDL